MATTDTPVDTLVAKWDRLSQGLTVAQQETILTNLLGSPSTLETLRGMPEEKKEDLLSTLGEMGSGIREFL